jgi:ATP-dependent DNA helicase RecQ
VAQGILDPDPAHGGLALAPPAAEVLRGTREVRFRRERRGEARRARRQAATAAAALDPAEEEMWETLRAWRLGEARRQEVPPYVIFHDATLIEVARRRPASLDALGRIPGVGRSKLDRYGTALIALVAPSAGAE